MTLRRESENSDWRRRAQQGARDIAFAVALTISAVSLIGVAWLGKHRSVDPKIGPSAEFIAP